MGCPVVGMVRRGVRVPSGTGSEKARSQGFGVTPPEERRVCATEREFAGGLELEDGGLRARFWVGPISLGGPEQRCWRRTGLDRPGWGARSGSGGFEGGGILNNGFTAVTAGSGRWPLACGGPFRAGALVVVVAGRAGVALGLDSGRGVNRRVVHEHDD